MITIIRQLIIILLALFLMQTLPVQAEEDEPEQLSVSCEFYFNSWEINKEAGATGIFFWLGDEALIFAKDELSALHEVGHLVNIQRGMISSTERFIDAVDSYLGEEWDGEDMVYYRLSFLFYQGGGYEEVYAELYMMNIVSDSIPVIFSQFYR